jgi:hypothetical protein
MSIYNDIGNSLVEMPMQDKLTENAGGGRQPAWADQFAK